MFRIFGQTATKDEGAIVTCRHEAIPARPPLKVRRVGARRAAFIVMCIAPATPQMAQAAVPGDIVVTAEKRVDTIINTPMSITVLTGDTLRAVDADDFADFAKLVPGLSYLDSGPGNKRYALRGLQSAGEPEVALYYDEIPVSGLPGGSLDTGDSQPDLKLVDIDRIEVLRGPQGTLYGNGSMGGAIRILSKRPVLGQLSGETEATGAATAAGAPSWRLNSVMNVPLGDNVAIRAMGYYRHEGGWIDDVKRPEILLPQIPGNNSNTERTWGGRVSILIQPTAAWTITGIAYYQSMVTQGSFATYPAFATAGDRFVSQAYVRTPWRDRSLMYNLISDYDLGWATATLTGSYQRRTLQRNLDTTRFLLSLSACNEFTVNVSCSNAFPLPADSASSESVRAWSTEGRLASKGSGPFRWTVGGFAQDASTYRDGQVATTDADGLIVYGSDGVASNRVFARTNADTFDQYAFFGEASYELVHRVTLTTGLRWFHSDRSDRQTIVQQFFPSQPTGAQPDQHFSEGRLFKKIELSYSLGARGLVYAQAAQGFRAGGPNYPGGFNVSAPPYSSDSVWDYELGLKLDLLEKRLYIEADLFDIEWRKLQELVPTSLFNYIANAGKARSKGFEASVVVTPTTNLHLSAGVTYNNARLVGPQPLQIDPTLQLRAGDRLAGAPDWTGNAGVVYERAIGTGYLLTGRFDARYESDRTTSVAPEGPGYFVLKPFVLCDLHVALQLPSQVRIAVNVANLFDKFAELSGKQLDSNLVRTVTAARPRTISASLGFSY
jgi:outer membrane receptor protein involved in Fe transport